MQLPENSVNETRKLREDLRISLYELDRGGPQSFRILRRMLDKGDHAFLIAARGLLGRDTGVRNVAVHTVLTERPE